MELANYPSLLHSEPLDFLFSVVDERSYGLKMVGIDAGSHMASMVNVQVARERTLVGRIEIPVRQHSFTSLAKIAVAMFVGRTLPDPAWRLESSIFNLETILWRFLVCSLFVVVNVGHVLALDRTLTRIRVLGNRGSLAAAAHAQTGWVRTLYSAMLHVAVAGRESVRKAFNYTSSVNGCVGDAGWCSASALAETRRVRVFGGSILGLHLPVMAKSVSSFNKLTATASARLFHTATSIRRSAVNH